MQRKSDIEIYARGCSVEKLIAWISNNIGVMKSESDEQGVMVFASKIGPVTISSEDNSTVSIYFLSPDTPWATDVECGRQAARELDCSIYCDPSPDYPEVNPLADIFLEILADGTERLFDIDELPSKFD